MNRPSPLFNHKSSIAHPSRKGKHAFGVLQQRPEGHSHKFNDQKSLSQNIIVMIKFKAMTSKIRGMRMMTPSMIDTDIENPKGASRLGEKYKLDIRPTFIDKLDRVVIYIEQHLCNTLL